MAGGGGVCQGARTTMMWNEYAAADSLGCVCCAFESESRRSLPCEPCAHFFFFFNNRGDGERVKFKGQPGTDVIFRKVEEGGVELQEVMRTWWRTCLTLESGGKV